MFRLFLFLGFRFFIVSRFFVRVVFFVHKFVGKGKRIVRIVKHTFNRNVVVNKLFFRLFCFFLFFCIFFFRLLFRFFFRSYGIVEFKNIYVFHFRRVVQQCFGKFVVFLFRLFDVVAKVKVIRLFFLKFLLFTAFFAKFFKKEFCGVICRVKGKCRRIFVLCLCVVSYFFVKTGKVYPGAGILVV